MEPATWEHSEEWNEGLTLRDRILYNVHGVMDEALHNYAVRHEVAKGHVFPGEALWNDAMCTALVAVVDFLDDYADDWAELLSPRLRELLKDGD